MYKEIRKCRICGNSDLRQVLDLGMQKLTGVFPLPEEEIEEGPLQLVRCNGENSCGLVQLKHSFEREKMYGDNYGYRSGLNRSMINHLKDITCEIKERDIIEAGDMILDIGSNDGTLLSTYGRTDLDLVGMDPTGVKFSKYYPEEVMLICDFFSADKLLSIKNGKKAKVITSIAMFYDLEDPIAFAKDIEKMLEDNGIWVFEQSYMPFMLEAVSYDTVCHEHLEFYGLYQIDWILSRSGLKMIDVNLNDTNGGSFRVTAAKLDSEYKISDNVSCVLKKEVEKGYNGVEPFEAFTTKIEEHKKELISFLRHQKENGKLVLGYGASTKGNVLLQYCGISVEDIPAIAEVNPDKFGKVTPGTNIPIISEDEARKMNPDYFLVLPWHFKSNILEKEKEYIKKSHCEFVFPLPFFDIVKA